MSHIDGIGIIRAGRHIDDLAFYRIRADTDGACRSFCRLNGIYLCRVGTGRNVSIGCLLTVGNAVSAECHASIYLGIGINTHGNGFFPLLRAKGPIAVLASPSAKALRPIAIEASPAAWLIAPSATDAVPMEAVLT